MNLFLNSSAKSIPKVFWIIVLSVILAILISQTPASTLASTVDRQSDCRVVLHQPIGTIWNGSAALGFSEPDLVSGSCLAPAALTERLTWNTQCSVVNGQCLVEINFVMSKQLFACFLVIKCIK